VDSERILTQLKVEGYDVVGSYEDADLVVVNTCGFIDEAVEESLQAIGEAIAENGKVVVTGCLGVKADLIRSRYPEVLAVTGPQRYEEVVEAVHAHLPPRSDPFVDLLPPQGIKLTPRHYAYLKIAEGCNHKCSFCIIPSMRGRLSSRRAVDVLAEAERLVDVGVKELLVISQDTSAYLAGALGELGAWVRLHYVYPYPHVDDLIPLMAEGRLLPYLDVPLQHASPRILKLMRRPAAAEDNLARIHAWREVCPDITVRSTFIVGFPSETDEDFEILLEFLQAARIDRAGCFEYSPVAGAAANALPDAVPDAVKQERHARFMETQARISTERLAEKVGRRMQVLVDAIEDGRAVARSSADAPEIDGLVYVEDASGLEPGQFAEVVIEASDTHDLFARPA
jgi:ribosomal protein S12 methylthiotransferase